MNNEELITALGRLKVATGSLACLGCGHEHNCSTHGCAIIRAALERINDMQRPSETPKTRADIIRGSDDAEMASMMFECVGESVYCKNLAECMELVDQDCLIPEENCKRCLLEWLKQMSGQKRSIPIPAWASTIMARFERSL